MAKRFTRKKAAERAVSRPVVRKIVSAPPPPSWVRQDWLWGLVLVLAVILTYTPVWAAGFIWDDDVNVTTNPCIIGPLGLKEIWTSSHAGYFPLVLTTFWVEHALWGLQPLPYHLVNILLHGACAVLFWRVLCSLRVPGAWLGAALWALHPVQVETVAWITELKNTQSCLFYLLAIRFFLEWQNREILGRKGNERDYLLALLFALLAILSKPSTVILPAVLGLVWWWRGGRWRGRDALRLAPFFLISMAASFWAIVEQKFHAGALGLEWAQTWPERWVIAGKAVWFYLGKLVWPDPLIFIYPRWEIDSSHLTAYLPMIAAALVPGVLWRYRNQGLLPVFFAFAYFLIALVPVLGFFSVYFFRYSFVGDHFQYLASMGPLALAGAGLARLADFVKPKNPWLPSTLGTGVLLVLGGLSWQQACIYQNEETLWTETLAQNPNCGMAHDNLGVILTQKGEVDEGIEHLQKALAINPGDVEACNNLGNALLQKGQVGEAMAQFQRALKIDLNDAKTHYNLGNALLQKGEMNEAVEQFQRAVDINPNYNDAHTNLGIALIQKGDMNKAIEQFQKVLELNPNNVSAHINLGNALLQKGRVDEAIVRYQEALEINPNFAEIYYNIGRALMQKGQWNEAIIQFQEALRLKPDFTAAQNNLAEAQKKAGRTPGSK